MKPVVSVIMPAFNVGRWIGQAIESVLNQTLREVEVLVVDDASTDNTVEVVQSIRDDRVRLLRLPDNRGVSAARNVAIEHARGRWAAILDADDWFARRDRLQNLVALGDEYSADIVADDIYLVEDGRGYAWTTMLAEKNLRLHGPRWMDLAEFITCDLGPIKPIVKAAFLRSNGLRYDEGLRRAEDWAFYMECLLAGARLLLVPQAGYVYRWRPGSLSRSVLALLMQVEENHRRLMNDERVRARPEVLAALGAKLRELEETRRYYEVMAPLKEGRVGEAVREVLRTPDFPGLFVKRIPRILRYRLRRRLVRLSLPGLAP